MHQLPSPFHTTRLSYLWLSRETPVPEESRVGTSLAGRGPFCSWHGRPCPQKEGPEGNPRAICIMAAMRATDIRREMSVRMQPRTDGGGERCKCLGCKLIKSPFKRASPSQTRKASSCQGPETLVGSACSPVWPPGHKTLPPLHPWASALAHPASAGPERGGERRAAQPVINMLLEEHPNAAPVILLLRRKMFKMIWVTQ